MEGPYRSPDGHRRSSTGNREGVVCPSDYGWKREKTMRSRECDVCWFSSVPHGLPPSPQLGRLQPRSAALAVGQDAGPLLLVEDDFADADRLRGDLHAFVLAAELQRLLQGELARRGEAFELLGGGGAHVADLALLGDVDVDVVGTGVLADHHALVDLGARLHEKRASLLQAEHGIGGGFAA